MVEQKLTSKQAAFINEYMIDFNATQAAIRAGYSVETARQNGYETLAKPYIKSEIDKRMKELEEKALITREMVIKGLLSEAQEFGDGASHSARVASWAHLGKHLGMFTDKLEVKSDIVINKGLDDFYADVEETES